MKNVRKIILEAAMEIFINESTEKILNIEMTGMTKISFYEN